MQGKLLEVCLLQFAVSEILCRVFNREPSPFIFITATICAIYSLYRLLTLARTPITLDGRPHPRQGKMLLLLFPICSVLFVLLHLLSPLRWVDINTDEAGNGILHAYAVAATALKALGQATLHSPAGQDPGFGGEDVGDSMAFEVCNLHFRMFPASPVDVCHSSTRPSSV